MENSKLDRDAALAAVKICHAVADAIRELGRVPNGHLYANLMSRMSLETYTKIIDILKGAGLIEERANELIWKGPQKENV